ncbi:MULTISPECIES: DAK2 domain-containing protein [Turicibacter]|jgi:DAK2 domain fusion protein yloV|uniref:DAK2 domain-containing protein n=2 Tax=Turicibacter sanguinis TaxID=154288 RepID=A0A173QZ97_9FIRM|nr:MULTISPECIES: DAK2 domain-containing protein [Turicibacter]EFF63316.1 DAK2 domain fusion protein YloV [Turicibacter sanguinis PC909]EGC92260.1 DAK2 domain fusion protein YloV [Turicibacter sp. HGF1]MBP3903415.1 DAK2 domain-containing protein [Turicibacter sp.]MCU7190715.1 DAK2 domain-containing protein [Turicibacter sanguinis]MCU7196241.1 DAK2 domain-containing protein [Turicibacter sanguinis]
MSLKQINGIVFKQMVINGANNLANKSKYVDQLNVFPVPDGDTGTNMSMTMTAGAKELVSLNEASIGKVAKVLSRGLLMGARGNSGVILSQLFRGFATGLEGKDEASIEEIAFALESGVKTAYKAVMKPVEGTILTVARESAEAAVCKYETVETITDLYELVVNEMQISLDRTPDLLPVLKEVGVVDSGGQGLTYIFEGFLKALKGEVINLEQVSETTQESAQMALSSDEIEFGYCTEFILRLDEERTPFKEEVFRGRLEKLGNSIVVVQDEDIVKVHVHTLTPGEALTLAQKHGEFVKLKIENMTEQHNEIIGQNSSEPAMPATKEQVEYGIISVVAGEGIKHLFEEQGCHYVIEGGQTMNPSTEDFLKAIDELNAKNIIILPNNSNIIMAANQAAQVTEDINVVVIPSKTIPQGYTSLIMFNENASVTENTEVMTQAITEVKSGQVTYAVRDTQMNGVDIKENDFIGILDKDIVVSVPDRFESACALVDKMIDEDSEIVTIIYGEGTDEDEADELAEYIENKYDDVEVTIFNGEQPVYSYIISVE